MHKLSCLLILSLVFISLASACSRNPEIQGYMFRPEDLAALTPGQTTKEEVQRKLGSPSSKSDFGPETWFYISRKTESMAFFEPKTTDQQVMALEFNGEVLANIKKLGLQDAKKVAFAKDTTPTEGHSIGLMEQLLGNVGKFNRAESARTPGAKLPGGGPAQPY